jgi:hypothetical protein
MSRFGAIGCELTLPSGVYLIVAAPAGTASEPSDAMWLKKDGQGKELWFKGNSQLSGHRSLIPSSTGDPESPTSRLSLEMDPDLTKGLDPNQISELDHQLTVLWQMVRASSSSQQ